MTSFQTFSFTAFNETDLADGGISTGIVFAAPESASLTIDVQDGERFLSGDSIVNEFATDRIGQDAAILSNGEDIGNGGKIYAERVWTLVGSDGETYSLVEIEQEHSNEDYFTFFGDVPPAGTELTVTSSSNVTFFSRIDYPHLSAGPVPQPNIVDIAAGSDDFNILVMALTAAGLVETVRDADDITVFAPTDAAFTQLAIDLGFDGDQSDEDAVFAFIAGALADLNNGDAIPLLTDILLYHVSPGAKTAAEIDALDQVPTLLTDATFGSEGTELVDNEPDIANPNIVANDIDASNGTIQGIDRVLLPIDIPGNEPNIVDIAAGSDDFNILVMALTAAGLVDTVRDADDITVFAPTDAAFTQLAIDLGFDGDQSDEDAVFAFIAGALADLNNGDAISLLTDILLYHVSPGAKTAAEVDALDEVPTLLTGSTFGSEGTELVDNEPDVANPNIVAEDIDASNGTIQGIDRVLIPIDIPGNEPPPNIVDIATGSDDFNILVMALTAAGLVETVRDATDITVFAPTDAAFTQLAIDLGFDGDQSDEDAVFGFIAGALADLNNGDAIPLLTDILLYHVSPGAKTAAEIDALDEVPTLLTDATFGSEGTELVDNEPDVANPNIVANDIDASNGTIQGIDRVLLPIDVPGNEVDQQIAGTFRSDDLSGANGDDTILGFAGRDWLDGEGGDDTIFGGNGRDDINGGDGNDHLFGGNGRDTIEGGAGDDKIEGGGGRDLLSGGEGDDHLTGGRGGDWFDFRTISGDDVIKDLSRSDEVFLSDTDFSDFDALLAAVTADGNGDAVITAATGSITLAGVDADRLNEDNFFFV
ncbi:MAG: fasciclin domain-containing protein [Pseudomonadota bacterium]